MSQAAVVIHPRMLKGVLSLVAFAVLVYLAICAALFAFQRSLIYFPQPRSFGSPESVLKLSSGDAELVISVRPRSGAKALVYFGGNAEDVSINLPAFSQAFPDHAIYLMHYRAYGGSTGSPSEDAIQRDALALFDRIQSMHGRISIVGRSLGTGVAVRLASQRPAASLALVTPYSSLLEIAQAQYPYVPVKWLMQDKFESAQFAGGITVPTLLIAAENDEIIPRASTEKLFARFSPGVASMQVIPGTGHNTISESPRYLELLARALL